MDNLNRSVSNSSIGLNYPNSNNMSSNNIGSASSNLNNNTNSNNGFSNNSQPKSLIETAMAFKERLDKESFSDLVHECRNSRKLVLLVVFIALFFDNVLLTTVGKFPTRKSDDFDQPR